MSTFKIIMNTRVDNDLVKRLNPENAIRGMQEGMDEIGKNLVRTAQEGIKNPPASGRIYIINGRAHQASSAGQYPASVTGKLMNSISHEVDSLTMEFGSDSPYAPFLQQFKTPRQRVSKWKKIAPRPFQTLSHEENKGDFVKIMNANMRANL